MNNQIKYFVYARKSSEGEDRQMASIEDQNNEMEKLAERLGLEVVDIITESKSAKAPGARPKFNEMLARIEAGEANGILCWKLNRLARNPVDGGRISWMLQDGTLQHIQTYGSDYKPSDNVLMMQVEFGMANQYVKDLGVDVKRAQRQKAEKGWHPASTLAMGYVHNSPRIRKYDTDDEIVPDPARFSIIKKLWNEMLTGGHSVASIKRMAEKLGLRNRNGNKYSTNSYHLMFANHFYCGYFYWNDENGIPVRIRGKHKTIVTEREFNRVQTILGNRTNFSGMSSYQFPFTGSVSCGECNCAVTAEHKLQAICTECKKKFSIKTKTACPNCKTELSDMKNPTILDKTYYHCTKRRGTCSQKGLEKAEIERQIRELTETINIPRDFYEWAVEGFKYIHKNEVTEQQKIVSQVKKRETEILKRMDNLLRMRADNEITAAQLSSMNEESEKELEEIRSDSKRLHVRATDWLDDANEYLSFAQNVTESFNEGDDKKKREVLLNLGSNLTLIDKKLCVVMPKPLIGIRDTYEAIKDKKEWFEPKKALDKQGLLKGNRVPISVGLAGLREVRTYLVGSV